MICKEGPGDETQRGNVAERADIEKSTPSQPVNQPEADKGENEIGDANPDGLQERGFCAEAGKFKYAGREVQNRIDARELVEEGNQNGEQDRFAKTSRPEMSGRRLLGGCSYDRVRLGRNFGFRRIRFDPLQDLHPGIAVALPALQPTRAFGKAETERSVEQRRK